MSDSSEKFLNSLITGIGYSPKADRKEFYLRKLKRWNLSDKQWQQACDALVEEQEKFPSLSTIYTYLKSALGVSAREHPIIWQTWLDHKKSCARKIKSPAYSPDIPAGGNDAHVVIPPESQAHYEPCSWEEGSKIWREEFLRVYPDAPQDVIAKHFGLIRKPAEDDEIPF